jgi:hypothetical protein
LDLVPFRPRVAQVVRHSCIRRSRAPLALTALAAGALVTLLAREGRAEQFILFDATFTYTWEDANNSSPSKSHYYVNDENFMNVDRPDNWLSPVDYRNGTVHIRLEVMDKPAGEQVTGWALCYIANSGGYGCPYTTYDAGEGVFERDVDMTSFYNNDAIGWENGLKQVDLIYTVNDSGSGHITNFPDLKDLITPTTVRLTAIQVSAGETYDPSIIGGGSGGSGGGGGTGGSAGSAGSAGASGGGTGGSAGSAGSGGAGGALTTPMGGMAGTLATGGVAGTGGGGTGGTASRAASPAAPACSLSSSSRGTNTLGAWLGLGLALLVRRRRARASQRLDCQGGLSASR